MHLHHFIILLEGPWPPRVDDQRVSYGVTFCVSWGCKGATRLFYDPQVLPSRGMLSANL